MRNSQRKSSESRSDSILTADQSDVIVGGVGCLKRSTLPYLREAEES